MDFYQLVIIQDGRLPFYLPPSKGEGILASSVASLDGGNGPDDPALETEICILIGLHDFLDAHRFRHVSPKQSNPLIVPLHGIARVGSVGLLSSGGGRRIAHGCHLSSAIAEKRKVGMGCRIAAFRLSEPFTTAFTIRT